jgi:hypothetical protein
VSIYASIEGIGGDGDPEHLGQPWQYDGSHILPVEDGPRGGVIGLALIPSHISRDGRDDQPEDGTPWPWLRLHLVVDGDDPCVLIDPTQARFLASQLATWAARADGKIPRADRVPLDHLTSDQYDELCDDLDRYEDLQGDMNERAIDLTIRAEQAEATVARVRAIHSHGPRTNTCNDCGQPWPCEVTRALDEQPGPA